jgi:hypothetical protein
MGFLNTALLGSVAAILLGLVMSAVGLYAARRRRFRYRQGAKVLAGLAVAFGLAVAAAGAVVGLLNLKLVG